MSKTSLGLWECNSKSSRGQHDWNLVCVRLTWKLKYIIVSWQSLWCAACLSVQITWVPAVFLKGFIFILLSTIWYDFYCLYCYGNGVEKRQWTFIFLRKMRRFKTSLRQARSHNLVDTRALPHVHQLGLCPQALGRESGGHVGGAHPGSVPPRWGSSAHQTPCSSCCSRLSRGHRAAMRSACKLLWPEWSSSTASMDTEENGEGGRAGKNRGNTRPFFTKTSAYLLLTIGCMCLFIHACKRYVNYNNIIMFFLTFECFLFFRYQSVVNFSQKLFLVSRGTCQIGCKTATTGMSQAESKLSVGCTVLMVLQWLYMEDCNHKMLKEISMLWIQKVFTQTL